jgi:hypothetical protein
VSTCASFFPPDPLTPMISSKCFAFLTIVGASKITTCVDLPWGIVPQVVIPQCAGWESWPEAMGRPCNQSIARSYCPDTTDSQAPVSFLSDQERATPYTSYTPSTGGCTPPTGCTAVTVPAVPGNCSGGTITGVTDAPFGALTDFSIAWTTDCASQEVTITLRARSNGWIGVGLHDAGTATQSIPVPSTKMFNADIVQGSPSGLRDRMGQASYNVPVDKATPVATSVSSSRSLGYTEVEFKRPFVSAQGVTLAPDRFVWVIAAVNAASDDLDAAHTTKGALPARISLFGGRSESQTSTCVSVGTTTGNPGTGTVATGPGSVSAGLALTSSNAVGALLAALATLLR